LVRRRFQAWWQARLPLRDTTTLTQRNVYILPTRPGFTLAATPANSTDLLFLQTLARQGAA
jgi:hypothetical protein